MKKPFIVAELSGNHNGDLNRALRIVDAAKQTGASAIKLQTYTADTITIDCDRPEFIVKLDLWKERKLYELYQEAHTPWAWHAEIFRRGVEIGIPVFSSPFDETAVDFLEDLGCPIYKIASFELVDTPLIEYAARTGKPLIMSTGMATLAEIHDAVAAARRGGCENLSLLHCISHYPTPYAQANLATMVALKKEFPTLRVGISDHTMGTTVSVASVALGAEIIEKHFTLNRADGGVDSAFSLEPKEMEQLVTDAGIAAACIGTVDFEKVGEEPSRKYRPSLYVVTAITKGEKFSHENVRSIRPGNGLAPKELPRVIGMTSTMDIARGTPLSEAHLAVR